ncbi:MAG: deoxyguanosinetriphosphate triphosphohydrolase [Candidatus Omnitrophica bacterium]|nr:deoxyguanosinetriphosphate triphosphohydrolase [Candidatus Omnitrophota bacterium]
MRTREDIEALEEEILAPYAMKSKDTAGRIYQEPSHDVRTCYQRDRDRVVHCEAFRKLEYKTQVFVIFEGDYYRTRLTHTIEVAQIARTIGRALQLNEDLIEAIALAHDLGHPPFGHAGEGALNEIMQSAHVPGFNHNVRSFEIVTKYEKRYPEFDGLNLTEEVLVGILKHRTIYDRPGIVGEYAGKGQTLEALAVDIADSLAYLSHDIDDGITSGCISEDDLRDSNLWAKAYSRVDATLEARDRQMFKYQIVKALIDIQMKDLLVTSSKRLQELGLRSSREAKEYNLQHPSESVVDFSPTTRQERDYLQNILGKKLYHHYRVVRMTDKARRIIRDLFEVYKENPTQLPYSVYRRDRQYSDIEKYETIGNYIASMTDRFALDEHKKLFDPYQKV